MKFTQVTEATWHTMITLCTNHINRAVKLNQYAFNAIMSITCKKFLKTTRMHKNMMGKDKKHILHMHTYTHRHTHTHT